VAVAVTERLHQTIGVAVVVVWEFMVEEQMASIIAHRMAVLVAAMEQATELVTEVIMAVAVAVHLVFFKAQLEMVVAVL
jgi:hypothetical protein